MATERRVIFQAGRLWYAKQYLPLRGSAPASQRRDRREYSTAIREAINFRTSIEKLWLLLECNFSPTDLYVSLTYRNESLPKTKDAAEKCLTQFIRELRKRRKEVSGDLFYIRITEGYHSGGRLHHHLIVNAIGDDYGVIRECWKRYGDSVEILPYCCKSSYQHADYLTKEPKKKGRRRVGERMWRASKNLKRPITIIEDVPAGESIVVPYGFRIVNERNQNNTFGRFQYISAILEPDMRNTDLG